MGVFRGVKKYFLNFLGGKILVNRLFQGFQMARESINRSIQALITDVHRVLHHMGHHNQLQNIWRVKCLWSLDFFSQDIWRVKLWWIVMDLPIFSPSKYFPHIKCYNINPSSGTLPITAALAKALADTPCSIILRKHRITSKIYRKLWLHSLWNHNKT